MTCLSCEERARLLRQARDAFHSGDHDAASRILGEVFGTIKIDIKNLAATSIFRKDQRGRSYTVTLEEIAAADPSDKRPTEEVKK